MYAFSCYRNVIDSDHGAAGILLSRSKVNVILNGRYSDLIENDIKVAVNTILKEGILEKLKSMKSNIELYKYLIQ